MTYTVKISDYAGKPVEAETSLAMVDLAVLSLLDRLQLPIADQFYGERGLGIRTTLEVLKDAKDLTWEVGQTQLNGQPMMYTYQVATGSAPGEGGGSYSFTNAFIAYYNDGVNQIRVIGQYKDDPVSKADLIRIAPKQDLEALALSFVDVYTQAW